MCYQELKKLTEAIERTPENIDLYKKRASLYRGYLKDYQKAIDDYTKIIELEPNNPFHYKDRCDIYIYNVDDYEKALADFSKMIKLDSCWYSARGDFYCDYLKDYEKALADFSRVIDLVNYDLGDQVSIRSKDDLDDLDDYIVYKKAELSDLFLKRGNLYRCLNDYNNALKDYSKAVEIDPKSYYGYAIRGSFYDYYLKDYDKALKDYSKAIKFAPWVHEYYDMRGDLYRYKLFDYKKALEDYSAAININSKKTRKYYQKRGNLYENELNDYKKAIDDYKKSATMYYNSAKYYKGKGDYSEALKCCNTALKLISNNSYAKYKEKIKILYDEEYKSIYDYFCSHVNQDVYIESFYLYENGIIQGKGFIFVKEVIEKDNIFFVVGKYHFKNIEENIEIPIDTIENYKDIN